jgi:hypothetical protein
LAVLERDLSTSGAGCFHLDRTKDLALCREEIVPGIFVRRDGLNVVLEKPNLDQQLTDCPGLQIWIERIHRRPLRFGAFSGRPGAA